jgi:phosphohistidine phosphatase
MPASPNKLFVLRHAKSSWAEVGLDDHERPLAPRGHQAAKLIATHLHSERIAPTVVLCSSARRTRETLEAVAPPGQAVIEPWLYDARADTILEHLRDVPADTGSVMLIGHNPALQVLVLRLSAERDGTAADGALAAVRRKFPTGALATLTFACDWTALAPGCAELTSFVRPRDLG